MLKIILAFAVLLSSCTSNKGSTDQPFKVAYIAKLINESFHDSIYKGVKEESINQNIAIEHYFGSSQQDIDGQISFIKKIVHEKKVDGVMIAPNDSTKLVQYVGQLDKENIPFIFIDTQLEKNEATSNLKNNCGFVGTDNVLAGALAANHIASTLPKGNILLMRGNHAHQSSIDREQGFVHAIQNKHQFIIIEKLMGWWETQASFQSFSLFMKNSSRKIDAVFAYSDPMALGVSQYYDQSPEVRRPIIIGVDGVLLGQRAILQNKISASVVQSPELMGRLGVKQLVQCLKSKQIINSIMLTPVTLLKPAQTLETIGEKTYD